MTGLVAAEDGRAERAVPRRGPQLRRRQVAFDGPVNAYYRATWAAGQETPDENKTAARMRRLLDV
jgi:hypothetical protein